MWQADSSTHGKISSEFAERLACMAPHQRVRAIVMPAPYMVNSSRTNGNHARVRGEERQALIRESHTRTEQTFAEIDAVLARIGGQRLTESGNSLGFIVVETTANGIEAISELNWVGTVMEDQPVHPLRPPTPPTDQARPH